MAYLGKIRSKVGEVTSLLCSCQVAPSWGYLPACQLQRRDQPGGDMQEKETCRQEQKFLIGTTVEHPGLVGGVSAHDRRVET